MNTCPPDHRHGDNLTCYVQHRCRCDECREAATEYSFWLKAQVRANRPRLFDNTGTVRRIEALMAIGWSAAVISAKIGMTRQALMKITRSDRVRRVTMNKVAAVYEELSMRVPPRTNTGERVSASRTIAYARERRFVPPLGWDDIDTDPTPPVPERIDGYVSEPSIAIAMQGERVRLTNAERQLFIERRRAVILALSEEGKPATEIAAVTGWNEKMIERDRIALGIHREDVAA